MPSNYKTLERKEGYILGIKISITSKREVLDFVSSRLDSKEKFYVVTPNPENLLLATKDWLLAKAIRRSDFSVPDGIGLSQANKFLSFKENRNNIFRPVVLVFQGLLVGASTIINKSYLTKDLEVIKGRELFLEIMNILNQKKLRVYLFGGEHGEQETTLKELQKFYPNITYKTSYKFPHYGKNGQPVSVGDRKMHKNIVGSIKLFEPDFIFVAMNTPKQENWIYRNFFRLTNVTGAMTVGGTYNYIAGNMKTPPKWVENIGLEWLYRLIQEPKRFKRILNAVIIFPWNVFKYKLNLPNYSKLRTAVKIK